MSATNAALTLTSLAGTFFLLGSPATGAILGGMALCFAGWSLGGLVGRVITSRE